VTLVEIVRRKDLHVSAGLKPLVFAALSGIAVLAAGLVLLPIFGANDGSLGFRALLPFAASALPALFLQVRLAQFRATGQHLQLMSVALLTTAAFLAGLIWVASTVAMSGWVWLGALTLGAAIGRLMPLQLKEPL